MSDQPIPPAVSDDEDDGPDFKGLIVFLLSLAVLGLFYMKSSGAKADFEEAHKSEYAETEKGQEEFKEAARKDPEVKKWTVLFLLAGVVVVSIVIWQACDPFADSAQWVGVQMQIPGSVRGATLDAIASSMPELFTGIFFVIVAVQAMSNPALDLSPEEIAHQAGAEGYGSAIATCAGSAVYNMMLIPAVCALVISFSRPKRPTIDVEDSVILRDGVWFLGCEMALLLFLFGEEMHWWMGVFFLVAYAGYVLHLTIDAKRYRRKLPILKETVSRLGSEATVDDIVADMKSQKHKVHPVLVMNVWDEIHGEDPEDDEPDGAGILFGFGEIPLSHATAWPILIVCTILAAAACFFLVKITNEFSAVLGVPAFFVAVIVAAAASSVPDTFLSIGASQRGDDDGAVSNAFGSNIFDICICLSIPLFVSSALTGGAPVSLTQDGKAIPGLMGLRILLWVLSLATVLIIYHNNQLTRKKAFILIGLYGIFVLYAVLGSLGIISV